MSNNTGNNTAQFTSRDSHLIWNKHLPAFVVAALTAGQAIFLDGKKTNLQPMTGGMAGWKGATEADKANIHACFKREVTISTEQQDTAASRFLAKLQGVAEGQDPVEKALAELKSACAAAGVAVTQEIEDEFLKSEGLYAPPVASPQVVKPEVKAQA